MKYGLRRMNQSLGSDEEWRTSMEKNIDFLKLEISCLKLELQESKRRIELLTPRTMYGVPSGFKNGNINNINQNGLKGASPPPSTWPSKPIDITHKPIFTHMTSWPSPPPGTQLTPFKVTLDTDYSNFPPKTIRYNVITAMKQYEDRSLEELRWEDYVVFVVGVTVGPSNKENNNEFANPRSCFTPPTSVSTVFNCYNKQAENSGAAKPSSEEKPQVHHKTDCFDNLIQKEIMSQVLSKLKKMDKHFHNVNTRLTSVDCHLADIGSSVSVMESRLSAIDMHVTIQRVNKKWKGLESSLANLETSPQNQKSNPIFPPGEGVETSTTSSSNQSPSKDAMSVVTSGLSVSNATDGDRTSSDEESSNLSKSEMSIFSNCIQEIENLSYIQPSSIFIFKKGSNPRGGEILFGSPNTDGVHENTSDSRNTIPSNESSPLSIDMGENVHLAQKVTLRQSPFTFQKPPDKLLFVRKMFGDGRKLKKAWKGGKVLINTNCVEEKKAQKCKSSELSGSVIADQSLKNEENPWASGKHEVSITGTESVVIPKAKENQCFQETNSTSASGTSRNIEVCGKTTLEGLSEDKTNDKQETTVGCQTDDTILSSASYEGADEERTSTGNLLSSTSPVDNSLEGQKTTNPSEHTLETKANSQQRLSVSAEAKDLKVPESPKSVFSDSLYLASCSCSDACRISKETKSDIVAAVADEADSLNKEDNKSDEEFDFVVVEKSDLDVSDQGCEQVSELSEASKNNLDTFKVCNDITEYLEINLGKSKDLVYEFGFEVKPDIPDVASEAETSVRDLSKTESVTADSFSSFIEDFVANHKGKQSSPLPTAGKKQEMLMAIAKLKLKPQTSDTCNKPS
uniref:Uncharacterized protein n=1 Tax=Graphocephala atropunctata TaxID=36148 RepID=A0A1B6M555_9HEMI